MLGLWISCRIVLFVYYFVVISHACIDCTCTGNGINIFFLAYMYAVAIISHEGPQPCVLQVSYRVHTMYMYISDCWVCWYDSCFLFRPHHDIDAINRVVIFFLTCILALLHFFLLFLFFFVLASLRPGQACAHGFCTSSQVLCAAKKQTSSILKSEVGLAGWSIEQSCMCGAWCRARNKKNILSGTCLTLG